MTKSQRLHSAIERLTYTSPNGQKMHWAAMDTRKKCWLDVYNTYLAHLLDHQRCNSAQPPTLKMAQCAACSALQHMTYLMTL